MCILILIAISSVTADQNHIKINLMLTVPFKEFFNILETKVNISYKENIEFVFHFCRMKDKKNKDKNIKYLSFYDHLKL